MTDYPYAEGDLLEKRNTYFYSTYGGRGFLSAWERQRDTAMKTSSAAGVRPRKEGKTDGILSFLEKEIARNGDIDPSTWQQLDCLLQRFEVSKRLHGEYNDQWRPVNPDDYRDMERYVRFAEVLDQAYQRSRKLQYLNGLLKCMDTLSALTARLDALEKERVCRLTDSERSHIRTLADSLGLNCCEESS